MYPKYNYHPVSLTINFIQRIHFGQRANQLLPLLDGEEGVNWVCLGGIALACFSVFVDDEFKLRMSLPFLEFKFRSVVTENSAHSPTVEHGPYQGVYCPPSGLGMRHMCQPL